MDSSRLAHRRNGKYYFFVLRLTLHRVDLFLTTLNAAEYKNKGGLKQDDLRRRREEQQVEIRRQKREENISKRRNFLPSAVGDSDDESGPTSWESPVSAHYLVVPSSGLQSSFTTIARR